MPCCQGNAGKVLGAADPPDPARRVVRGQRGKRITVGLKCRAAALPHARRLLDHEFSIADQVEPGFAKRLRHFKRRDQRQPFGIIVMRPVRGWV